MATQSAPLKLRLDECPTEVSASLVVTTRGLAVGGDETLAGGLGAFRCDDLHRVVKCDALVGSQGKVQRSFAAGGIGAVDLVRHSRRGFDSNVEDMTQGT